MKIFDFGQELKQEVKKIKRAGQKIGFIPDIGDIHEGHISLILRAREECDIVIVSFKDKIKDLEKNKKACKTCGVDYLFIPLKPELSDTKIDLPKWLTGCLCAKKNIKYFENKYKILYWLFEIVQPDKVYVGQKNYQEFMLIKKVVQDRFEKEEIMTEVILCPIVRDKDGFALSSREEKLSSKARNKALLISEALEMAGDMFKWGELDTAQIYEKMIEILKEEPDLKIEYLDFRDIETLKPVSFIDGPTLIALAVTIDDVYLIDNVILKFDTLAIE